MDYDVIVIGAGNGGLSAACTLAQGGFKTLLLEQHNVAGGYATSFCRGRFEFEVALHQLAGLGTDDNPGPLRDVLTQLGVFDKLRLVEMSNLYRLSIPGLFDIVLPANRDAAIKVLKQKFPNESKNIDLFFALLYDCYDEFQQMYGYFFNSVDVNANIDDEASPAKYPTFCKYGLKNLQQVLDETFSHPLLKATVGAFSAYVGLPPRDITLLDLAMYLVLFLEHKPYHLKGGSQALSNALLEQFLAFGGKARFNSRVTRVLVENGKVTGVVTEKGESIKAKQVVANASPVTVYTDMIEPGCLPKEQSSLLRGSSISVGTVIIYAGLDCTPTAIGIDETTNFILNQVGGFMFSCYNVSDSDCSPTGTSMVSIVHYEKGESWLAVPPHQYFEKKMEVAGRLLDSIEQIYPGFKDHIEEIEVATPITNARYTCNPGGAIGGFSNYGRDGLLFAAPPSLIEGLHFVGAWTNPGGFHPTLIHGRAVGLRILEDEGQA